MSGGAFEQLGELDPESYGAFVKEGEGEIDLAVKANADVYVTGDISHHDGIDAVEKGIAVIDAGHYGIEKIFVPYMKEYLEREMPEIRIISCDQGAPFLET